MPLFDTIGHIAELVLVVVVLLLRRFDVRSLQAPLNAVAQGQQAVVALVTKSIRPGESRCADCEHAQGLHVDSMGRLSKCFAHFCACPAWLEPVRTSAVEFREEPTNPTLAAPKERRV